MQRHHDKFLGRAAFPRAPVRSTKRAMKIIAALFLAVLAAGPGRAELASFDGESVTYARDGTVYRGSLEPLMDGSPSWRPIYTAPGTIESVSCLVLSLLIRELPILAVVLLEQEVEDVLDSRTPPAID